MPDDMRNFRRAASIEAAEEIRRSKKRKGSTCQETRTDKP